jgi:hypothetical protein
MAEKGHRTPKKQVGTATRSTYCHPAVTRLNDPEGYAKLSLKKYMPIAARNEDTKVFNGLL